MYLIGTIEGIGGNMGSCDILLTRIFVNKIIIKSARETFMKNIYGQSMMRLQFLRSEKLLKKESHLERLLCTKIVWLRLSMTVTGLQMDHQISVIL